MIIQQGELIPNWYGLAYRCDFSREAVCYPIPLNWLARWWHELVDAVRWPTSHTLREEVFDRGYKLGREHQRALDESRVARAYEQGRSAAYREIAARWTEVLR